MKVYVLQTNIHYENNDINNIYLSYDKAKEEALEFAAKSPSFESHKITESKNDFYISGSGISLSVTEHQVIE